jgi:hypothetical protein
MIKKSTALLGLLLFFTANSLIATHGNENHHNQQEQHKKTSYAKDLMDVFIGGLFLTGGIIVGHKAYEEGDAYYQTKSCYVSKFLGLEGFNVNFNDHDQIRYDLRRAAGWGLIGVGGTVSLASSLLGLSLMLRGAKNMLQKI